MILKNHPIIFEQFNLNYEPWTEWISDENARWMRKITILSLKSYAYDETILLSIDVEEKLEQLRKSEKGAVVFKVEHYLN